MWPACCWFWFEGGVCCRWGGGLDEKADFFWRTGCRGRGGKTFEREGKHEVAKIFAKASSRARRETSAAILGKLADAQNHLDPIMARAVCARAQTHVSKHAASHKQDLCVFYIPPTCLHTHTSYQMARRGPGCAEWQLYEPRLGRAWNGMTRRVGIYRPAQLICVQSSAQERSSNNFLRIF